MPGSQLVSLSLSHSSFPYLVKPTLLRKSRAFIAKSSCGQRHTQQQQQLQQTR